MLKYVDAKVVFAEIPDEITLAISISGCPCHCKGCHSAYLAEDIGEELTPKVIDTLIRSNNGITCICFMGGDSNPLYIDFLAEYIKEHYPNIKVAWYSGKDTLYDKLDLCDFDYIKLGPYKEEYGPLDKRTTNQRFYKVAHTSAGKNKLYDITHKFWKHD